jgi:hypothetical protein
VEATWISIDEHPRSFTGACLPLLNLDRRMLTIVGELSARRNTIETEKEDLI